MMTTTRSTRSTKPASVRSQTHVATRDHVTTSVVVEAEPQLKRGTTRLIEDVRRPFHAHVTAFGTMHRKSVELAPSFMRAFGAYQADTGGTFVAFVRLFDDTVPPNRDPDPNERSNIGYRNHPTYRAADYLRRLAPLERAAEVEDHERPAGMSEAFVRLLAAIVTLIPEAQRARLWAIVGDELHWTERRVETLRTEVEQAEPLVEAGISKHHLTVSA